VMWLYLWVFTRYLPEKKARIGLLVKVLFVYIPCSLFAKNKLDNRLINQITRSILSCIQSQKSNKSILPNI
jgi:hypothetical protein